MDTIIKALVARGFEPSRISIHDFTAQGLGWLVVCPGATFWVNAAGEIQN